MFSRFIERKMKWVNQDWIAQDWSMTLTMRIYFGKIVRKTKSILKFFCIKLIPSQWQRQQIEISIKRDHMFQQIYFKPEWSILCKHNQIVAFHKRGKRKLRLGQRNEQIFFGNHENITRLTNRVIKEQRSPFFFIFFQYCYLQPN